MKYQGGKGRIARRLVETIVRLTPETSTRWVEPFVGGAWVLEAAHKVGRFDHLHIGDVHEDLILLYEAMADGWEPPTSIPRDLYESLRKAPPSPLRGAAGFGSAYGGVFLSGYCGDALNGKRTNAQIAAEHLVRRRPIFEAAEIRHTDYRTWDDVVDENSVIYCDPPYADTATYRGGDSSRSHGSRAPFDSVAFWAWCNRMAVERGAHVFVSEYSGPEWATEVWARTARQTVSAGAWNYSVTDRLFHLDPATTPADAEPFIIPSAPHVSNAPSIDGPAPTDQEVTK